MPVRALRPYLTVLNFVSLMANSGAYHLSRLEPLSVHSEGVAIACDGADDEALSMVAVVGLDADDSGEGQRHRLPCLERDGRRAFVVAAVAKER